MMHTSRCECSTAVIHEGRIWGLTSLWIMELSGFLAHLSRRLIGELIVYPWSGVRRPSVRPSSVHNAQTSSSHKPLGGLKPNFMWILLG